MSFGDIRTFMKNDDMAEKMSVQDNVPMRFRGIYIVNAPLWIRVVMTLMKPFMKKKLRSKMNIVKPAELINAIGIDNVHVKLGGAWNPASLDESLKEMFDFLDKIKV